jgi:hypothetical protein
MCGGWRVRLRDSVLRGWDAESDGGLYWLWGPTPARKLAWGVVSRVILRAATVALTFCAGEVALRLFLKVRDGAPFWGGPDSNAALVLDPRLGWRANERFQFHGMRTSYDGRRYRVDASLARDGFRMWGDVDSAAPKMLVLGDSYTEAVEVSNDRTYFAVMKGKLNAEVFAYGAGGYGTLQELMVLDRYLERIRPRLIVWQFMTNDYINNSLELERGSRINNNGAVRPYLIDGRVEYVMPRAWPLLRRWMSEWRLGEFLLSRVDRLMARLPTVEQRIAAEGMEHAGFRRSMAITSELLGRVKERAGRIPVILFCADGREPFFTATKRIAAERGIAFVGEVAEGLRAAEARHVEVRSADGEHWNEEGHRIAGEALSEYLMRQGYEVGFRGLKPTAAR